MARRILVIEDTPGTQAVLDAVLQYEGYEVCTATTGAEALACLDQNPDVIVLSSQIPDVSALELLTTIKAQAAIPVIVITADNAARHEVEVRASADAAHPRPLNLRVLFKQLAALLESVEPSPSQLAAARPATSARKPSRSTRRRGSSPRQR